MMQVPHLANRDFQLGNMSNWRRNTLPRSVCLASNSAVFVAMYFCNTAVFVVQYSCTSDHQTMWFLETC